MDVVFLVYIENINNEVGYIDPSKKLTQRNTTNQTMQTKNGIEKFRT